jgi:transketolase
MKGGLASSLADYFLDSGIQPKVFKRFGIPQVYAGFGSGEELRKKYGYAKEDVEKAIREMV